MKALFTAETDLVAWRLVAGAVLLTGILTGQQPSRGRPVHRRPGRLPGARLIKRIAPDAMAPTSAAATTRPQLAGSLFMGSWGERTTSDLVGFMQGAMPPGNPGSLGEATYLNIAAFILDSNGARPGHSGADRRDQRRHPLHRHRTTARADRSGRRGGAQAAAARARSAEARRSRGRSARRTRRSPRSDDPARPHRRRRSQKLHAQSPTPCCAIPIPTTG